MSAYNKDSMKAQFEEAIKANPYDRATRLVFADWLDEYGDDPDGAERQRAWTVEYQQAEDWLKEFGERIREYDDEDEPVVPLEAVVEAGRRAAEADEDSCLSGLGFKAESLMRDDATRDEFWKHWQAYTRTEVDEEVRSRRVFSCSC